MYKRRCVIEEGIVIRRGTHRNEASAFYLAPKVRDYLQEMGYQCTLETKHFLATTWGEMLRGKKIKSSFRKRGSLYVSFHNDDVNSFNGILFIDESETCDGMPSIVVEIPAVFREISNPHVLLKIEKWVNGNKHRRNYAVDWGYMRKVVDVKTSMATGLAGDEMIRKVAEGIIRYANDNYRGDLSISL